MGPTDYMGLRWALPCMQIICRKHTHTHTHTNTHNPQCDDDLDPSTHTLHASTYMHDGSMMMTFFLVSVCACVYWRLDRETMNSWAFEWKAWRERRRKEGSTEEGYELMRNEIMKLGKVILEKDSLIVESRSLGSNSGQIPTLPTFKRRKKKVERIQDG